MSNKFKFYKLEELCSAIIDCPHSTPIWKNKGIYIIRNYNLKNTIIDNNNLSYVDEETYLSRIKRAKPEEDDIIISREAPMGTVGIVPNDFICCLGQRLVLLKVNKEKCSPKYLFNALRSNYVQTQIQLINRTGSIVSNLNIPMLKDIKIPLIKQEKEIGILLNNIDKKIQLNNKINTELEAMAKTIYDYWFLQFEFPNEEGKPYKSSGGKMVYNQELKREIPEGWEVKSLCDCMDVLYGFPLSTKKFSETNGKNIIRIRDIPTNDTSIKTTEKVDDKYLSKFKDLLIGMDGNFHINFWCNNGDIINQRITRIRENANNISILQVFFEILPYIKAIEKNVARSTVAHLSDKDIKSLRILCPINKDKIYVKLNNILEKICINRLENQELVSLRDFLLPLLMNGQVGFNDSDEK